ncbi:putative fatty-acid--CoA ligase [Mobilicoccus pelagius NBRC 104925]|uniref:Putative fatty-acid--CoA ligase n=1 Tax=Mobilicoccus pelagius NBRC 104925 TaxID=1089455 RepID=H5UT29_9MICO|nr:putative fatty-acid--CoA ligase [Mobilicoccus pelagius NBRC 104925]
MEDRAEEIRGRLVRMPGVDPSWSRLVEAVDADGVPRTWHLLDTHAGRDATDVRGTLVCVHGNPTWSYLWRRLLAAPPEGWRVVAVDQLGMGFSEHPQGTLGKPRHLAQRLTDLTGLTDVLDLGDRVVVAGHDWGGMVATGWALAHRDRLAGIVLANTTVWHDFDTGLPLALRFSLAPASLRAGTVDTPAFVRGTTAVSSPRPPRPVRDAYAAPYATAADRAFVGQFVADIPTRPGDPTRATMTALADGLTALGQEPDPVPVLLLRGPKDPVFSEDHLRDLRRRLPHADVHRYEGASHLVLEDAPRTAADVAAWIRARVEGQAPDDDPAGAPRPTVSDLAVGTSTRPWAGLTRMAGEHPSALCVAEIRDGEPASAVSFGQLETAVEHVALGLRAAGVRPGDRVGLLVEPGVDLTTAVYACWRAGAVIVVADAGLGFAGMGRALRGAGTDHVVAMSTALAALPAMRIPGQRFVAGDVPAAARRALSVAATLDELRAAGRELAAAGESMPELLTGDADAAVLYTSGATGPSKGVVYTVDQIRAQVGGFGHIYRLRPGDRLVAAFAPFALYGPALGVAGVAPDMKVTAPATLTAAALADAIRIAEATTVFASPAALRNVLRTGGDVTAEQREALGRVEVLMSAGAPVPASLLQELRDTLMPRAEMHTPYGMTECLPVSDITLDEIESLTGAPDEGVCVGRPIAGVSLAVAPLPAEVGDGDGPLTIEAGVTGEVCVRAAHMLDRYDQLWATTHAAEHHPLGWHRTGDVGHLDAEGRLWVEGRRVHVVHTPAGPVTPVGLEQRVEALPEVASAAVVGVGPVDTQQIVVVVTREETATDASDTSGASDATGPTDGTDGADAPAAGARRVLRAVAGRLGVARRAPRVLADDALATAVRESTDLPVAAVLVRASMPVDIRHQSKIDRAELAAWAEQVLSGGIGR